MRRHLDDHPNRLNQSELEGRPTSNSSRSGVAPTSSSGSGPKPPQRQPLALIQETVSAVGASAPQDGMQSGVHFSLPPSGYPARVAAATTLSQGSHGQAPPVHLQAHSNVQIVHPLQQPNSQMQGHQMQFQKLKVEDALSYLDQVKYKFGNQPQVYNDFLDIMKEFKSQSIDTPGVIQRVSNLFRGHPELIVGFNTFLPPGYRIEVQPNEQVQVSIPGGGPTASLTIHPTGPPSHNNHHSPQQSSTHKSSPHPSPIVNSAQVSHMNSSVVYGNQSSPARPQSSSPSPPSQVAPAQASQPVEFNHAINYVNKIKNRFQGQPDIYKQFLEILHTYQKEQRNLKDGVHSTISMKPLTEAEVYSQVAKLFQNQDDLLQEFGQFLPDANGAANALVNLELSRVATLNKTYSPLLQQPPKTPTTEHNSAAKKAIIPVKPPSSSNQAKHVQSVKRPASSVPSPPVKKPKMTSLKDVTLTEAGKCGSLNEFAFFDKVRKALKSQEVYDNFLRCLIIYNQELISRSDLVLVVTPFLSKYGELFKWFKDFLGYKETNNIELIPKKVEIQDRERVVGEFATEIDYSSCIKYGASYRAVPRNYVQPKCTGRTNLCREVLNDTWVSFPSWSEDSTFVSSRKTQFEEYIYRCEDERFELDVVLETNLSTIRILETEMTKINRMSSEEKSRYRLDDTLGGSSSVIQQRAIRRIYGDKAADIIEGLKKNPASSVPLVLRRLKAKDEEWRKAQKSFNKIWRDQNEKFYLKSLDHMGINFKQNDVKNLRSKSILNEIETIYEERHEQADENATDIPTGPHLVLTYKSSEIYKDAANLVIHHVKRQTGTHKEDKQKIKQLMRQFVPDFFSVPRGELSDDEIDKDEDMETEDGNDSPKSSVYRDLLALSIPSLASNGPSSQDQHASNTSMDNSLPDESYTLMFVNNNWYIFLRLHHILCERLQKLYDHSQALIADELRDREERKQSTALALRLKPKNSIEVEMYYPNFLDMVKSLLDGNTESGQYEDSLREIFGIHAYLGFTLDKVIQNVVRQLQYLVGDESCTQWTSLFIEEGKNKATGGSCSTSAQRASAELAYQKRAEQMSEENLYKIIVYKDERKLTIELLDTDSDAVSDDQIGNKWNSFVRKYTSEESLASFVCEQLTKSPIFLPRQINNRWSHTKSGSPSVDSKESSEAAALRSIQEEIDEREIDLSRLEDGGAGEAVKGLVGLNARSKFLERMQQQSFSCGSETVCKFNVNSFKMTFIVNNENCLYKTWCLGNARKTHPKVSERLYKRFQNWHDGWLKSNVNEEQSRRCRNWLLGLCEDTVPTACISVDDPKHSPYHPFNRYKVERT